MMVSPEWYYEENLKGKTVVEIANQISTRMQKGLAGGSIRKK